MFDFTLSSRQIVPRGPHCPGMMMGSLFVPNKFECESIFRVVCSRFFALWFFSGSLVFDVFLSIVYTRLLRPRKSDDVVGAARFFLCEYGTCLHVCFSYYVVCCITQFI